MKAKLSFWAILAICLPCVGQVTNKVSELSIGTANTNSSFVMNTNVTGVQKTVTMPAYEALETLKALANWPQATNSLTMYSNTIVVRPTSNPIANGILLTNAVKLAGTLASATRPMTVYLPAGKYGTPTNTLPSVMFAVDYVSTYWEDGAIWWSGTVGGDSSFMFDDTAGAVAHCNIYGNGRFYYTNDGGNVLYTENASKVFFQAKSAYATDGSGTPGTSTSAPITWGSAASEITVDISDYIESATYDAVYGDVANNVKFRGHIREVRAVGDIFEFTGDSPEWGNVDIHFDIARQTHATGQPTWIQVGGRTKITGSQVFITSQTATIGSASSATNGMLEIGVIQYPANGTASPIQGVNSTVANLHIRNTLIYCPTNVDAISISNSAARPLILENVTLYNGFASTNWARGKTPSFITLIGNLGLAPYRPVGSQITVRGTNYFPAIFNNGSYVGNGSMTATGSITATGDITAGANLAGDSVTGNSLLIASQANLPNGAGPFSPTDGDLYFDNDWWAAGRGTWLTWDGTANVVIPAVLASDTPNNGDVITWHTGGTMTWEAPGGTTGTFGTLTASNYFGLGYTNAGSNAVQIVDMMGPPIVRSHINGNTTIVLTNMPAWTNAAFGSTVRIDARHTTGTVTIASLHPIDWGTKGFVIGSGDTNHIYISWNGAQLEGRTIADRYTGTGATVLSNAPTILTPVNRYVPTVITGTGGALTNFTLLSTYPEMLIAVSTNVSIRGVMNYDTSLADYWTLVLTNRSGSDRTLEFSQVTNDWTFAGTYGTNAPNTLTNNTRLMISARQRGTNIEVGYTYFRVH